MSTKIEEWGGPCRACGQHRLFRRTVDVPNHVLHAILSIFTCALWAIVWVILSATTTTSPWRCTHCGSLYQG